MLLHAKYFYFLDADMTYTKPHTSVIATAEQ